MPPQARRQDSAPRPKPSGCGKASQKGSKGQDGALPFESAELSGIVQALIGQNPNPVIVLRWADQNPIACPVVFVNELFTKLLGYALEDLTREHAGFVAELVGPAARIRVRNAIATGKSERIDTTVKAKSGTQLSVNVSVMPVAGVDHEREGYLLLLLHDTTELKQIAEKGESAGADVRSILDSARCLVWHAIAGEHLPPAPLPEGKGSDDGERFFWDYDTADDRSAQRWLPVNVADGETFLAAFTRAIHPDDHPLTIANLRKALAAGETRCAQEFRVQLESGEYVWIAEDVHIEPIDPHSWRLVGVCTDITEQKRIKEELAEERNLMRTLIDNLPDCIYFKDTKNRFIIDNGFHARLLGAGTSERVMGKTDFDFFPYEVATQFYMDELAIIQSGIPLINKEEAMALPNGRKIWHSTTKVPLRDHTGAVIGLVGISRDITAQRELAAERERLLVEAIDRADRDPLTSLWNHRALQRRLEQEADLALVRETSVAILIMDMDNFKFFNDAYGHTVGDEVLCEVSRGLHAACRPQDTLARFGGDEFAVLMPLPDASHAEELALKIVHSLDQLGYRPKGFDSIVPIKVSWGLAVYPDEAPARLDALALADGRLIRAKSGLGEGGELMERLSAQLSASVKGFGMLLALVNSVDNKDRYTRRHSEDVLLYALQIGRHLGLDSATCHTLQVAALLHDVGKIGVPDHILRKPARLTPEEYEQIQLHPTMGAIIVNSVPGFEDTLPAVRHHHERWDGRGYPDGLAGDDTPLVARVLSVADAYSAMTTDRPYRKGMSSDIALRILKEGSGTQWDPAIVAAFIAARAFPY